MNSGRTPSSASTGKVNLVCPGDRERELLGLRAPADEHGDLIAGLRCGDHAREHPARPVDGDRQLGAHGEPDPASDLGGALVEIEDRAGVREARVGDRRRGLLVADPADQRDVEPIDAARRELLGERRERVERVKL